MAEQLASLQKGDEWLNRPDLWTANTEYNFGNGLYGQRFSGTFGNPIVESNRKTYQESKTVSLLDIISCDGYFEYIVSGNSYRTSFKSSGMLTNGTLNIASMISYAVSPGTISLTLYTQQSYSSNPTYNVWMTYTKS